MFDLTNKVALVTGGNGGLGLAYARGLVKAGSSVAIWGRNEEKNKKAVSELKSLGGDVESFICDVTNEDQIASAFEIAAKGSSNSCMPFTVNGKVPSALRTIPV